MAASIGAVDECPRPDCDPECLGSWNWTWLDKATLNVGDGWVLFKWKEGNETRNIAIIHVSPHRLAMLVSLRTPCRGKST